jgi:hypothetical protein
MSQTLNGYNAAINTEIFGGGSGFLFLRQCEAVAPLIATVVVIAAVVVIAVVVVIVAIVVIEAVAAIAAVVVITVIVVIAAVVVIGAAVVIVAFLAWVIDTQKNSRQLRLHRLILSDKRSDVTHYKSSAST